MYATRETHLIVKEEGRPVLEDRDGQWKRDQEPPSSRRASACDDTETSRSVKERTVSSPLVLTVEEVARELRISKNSVYKLTIRPVNPLRSLDYSPGKTLFYGRELQRFLWASTTEGTKGEDA